MANITEEHLHHMARRHHATMLKFEGLRNKFDGWKGRATSTIENLGGAWLGGALEGRTGGAAVGPLPLHLGVGAVLLGASHFGVGGDRWGQDLHNVGNGFVGSWLAATGYAFGKRWQESGKIFGGGGHPWTQPYAPGGSPGVPPTTP